MRFPRHLLTAAAAVTGLLAAAPAHAATPLPITESFTGATYQAGWQQGGAARLTAALGQDTPGAGWLRLTGAVNNQFGYVFNDNAFPSTEGVLAEFDYAVHGGTGADGIVFFLYDGATTAAQFAPGPLGGSIGYSHCPQTATPGLNNAYVGVGFDTWGNFSLGSFCNQTGLPGNALLPNRVTVRAGETAPQPYGVLASQPTSQPLIATRSQARHVTVAIADGKLSTYIRYPDGQIQTVAKDVALPAGVPATLKLGFVAGTGGSNNNHEIRNTKVVKPVDLATTVTDGHAGAPRGGHTWTAVVRNGGTNPAPAVAVKAASPSSLTGVTWTCASTTGSCGAPSGTGLPDTTAALPAGASATYTVTATGAGAPDDVRLSVEAQPTGDTGELAPLDNAATDTTVLAPVNDVAPASGWDGTTATRTANGTWRGGALTHVTRWQVCDADGTGCEDAGATGAHWTPTDAVTGRTLRLAVTATNVAGEATAYGAPVALPTTDVTSGPADVTGPGGASVAFSTTGTSARCRLDEGAWTACTSPWTGDVAQAGEHVLEVRGHHGVLADATPAEHRWTVDAATAVELLGPAALVTDSTPELPIRATEAGTWALSIDGVPAATGTLDGEHRGVHVPAVPLAEGEHKAVVVLTDAVGNTAQDARTFVVDTVEPAAPVLRPLPFTPASPGEGRVIGWDSEPGTTSRCRLDEGTWEGCESPKTVVAPPGEHVLDVEVVDAAGLVSARSRATWHVAAPQAPAAPAQAQAQAQAQAAAPAEQAACTSRRTVRVHWSVPKGTRATTFRVVVDGRTAARLGARARAHTVDLRGRGKGTTRVQVLATGRGGTRLGTLRVYRTCEGVAAARTLPTVRLARRG